VPYPDRTRPVSQATTTACTRLRSRSFSQQARDMGLGGVLADHQVLGDLGAPDAASVSDWDYLVVTAEKR